MSICLLVGGMFHPAMTSETKRAETIGDRVEWICATLGISQSELARRAEMDRAHVSQIVRLSKNEGAGNFRVETLKRIAVAANVRLEWLITGEGSPFKSASEETRDQSPPRFDSLHNWSALLASARVLQPTVPEWAWSAVARSNPALTDSPTPGMVADLAVLYLKHLAPPSNSTKPQ